MNDSGNYKCFAENSLGSDETSCHVTVEECKYKKLNDILADKEHKSTLLSLQEAPAFDRKLVSYKFASIGEHVELRCTFIGTPAPQVAWLKNGEVIGSSQRMVISKSETDASLVFNSIQSMDEGEYSCKISNPRGIEVSKCQIELERIRERMTTVVEEKEVVAVQKKVTKKVVRKSDVEEITKASSSTSSSTLSSKTSTTTTATDNSLTTSTASSATTTSTKTEVEQSTTKKSKANFLKHIKSQNLSESDPLVLECEVSGKDSFEVTWLRNGKEIPENPDFLREKIENLFKLTVSEIFPEDSGVFSAELFCKETNETKLSSCSVIVKARDELELDPKFEIFPTSLNVEEGSLVKVDCKVVGTQPVTIKWSKDNNELAESERIKFESQPENGLYSLVIPTILSTDNGQYHATASNANGEVIAAFCLIVSFDA
jgi:titin